MKIYAYCSTLKLAFFLFFLGLWITLSAQAQGVFPIGTPDASLCSNTAPVAERSNVTPPGHWVNPARPGTGWEMYYLERESGQPLGSSSMYAIWNTYDSNRRPVWYVTDVVQWGNLNWGSRLNKLTWSDGKVTSTQVGNVAFTLVPSSPVKLALRWKLGQTGIENECIQDFSRANSRTPEANTTFSGLWLEPALNSYFVSYNILNFPDRYEELSIAQLYDSLGEPVWVLGQRTNPPAVLPPNTTVTYPLNYPYSNYSGGIPTASSGCTSACNGLEAAVGTFTREFSDSTNGSWNLNVPTFQSSNTQQTINWRRPASGVGNVVVRKFTQATSIEVNRTQCTLVAGTPCTVSVNWGTQPGVIGFPIRKNFNSSDPPVAISGANNVFADPIAALGVYRYELFSAPNGGGIY